MSSVTVRFVVVALLTLLSNVPLLFVSHLVDERQHYYEEAVDHVARAWGGQQALTGPFLIVPEVRQVVSRSGSHLGRTEQRQMRVILPHELKLQADTTHQQRQRSIYTVPVYQGNVHVTGSFRLPDATEVPDANLLWREARLVLGISSPHAVTQLSELQLGGNRQAFSSGTGEAWLADGMQARIPIDASRQEVGFSFDLALKGTRSLGISPLGADNHIEVTSTWPHPSFAGQFLPDSHDVGDGGFTAQWRLGENARNRPGTWLVHADTVYNFPQALVHLFQPTTPYVLINRGLKYAMLFISLTFLCFLAFELRKGLRVHYVQYGVVALGLVLFYVTLLSLSEHIGFAWAYTLAALVLTALVGWYAWLVSRKFVGHWVGVSVGGLLLSLYLCLYVLLLLQAYALLVGTAVLLVSLAALMYVTADLSVEETERGQPADPEQSGAALSG